MASPREREHLARAARALNAGAGGKPLPSLILTTDERRMRDPVSAARMLPKGAAILLRHTDPKAGTRLAAALQPVIREQGLLLIVAGDVRLATRVKAWGLHLPEARAREARHLKALHPNWLITAAAHSAKGVAVAARSGADAVFLAPVFATASHRDRAPLGLCRFRLMAARAPLSVYALGGINAKTAGRLRGACLAGLAAVEGLLPGHKA